MPNDFISREAAIDAVKGRFSMPVDYLIVEVMQKVPAADVRQTVDRFALEDACVSFCPNCGAGMRVEQGKEDAK